MHAGRLWLSGAHLETLVPTAVGVMCHAHRSVLADRDGDERPATAVAVVCAPRKHCALRALLPHPRARGWGSSGSAAWGPRSVAGHFRRTAVAGASPPAATSGGRATIRA